MDKLRKMATISPEELSARAIESLRAAADAERAEQIRRYFKSEEAIFCYGLKSAEARQLESDLYQLVKQSWTAREALAFCRRQIGQAELEAKGIGLLLLSRYQKSFETSLLREVERWMEAGHCGNWATTDVLCSLLLTPLIEKDPGVLPRIASWTRKRNLWLRRAAAVGLTAAARRGRHLDEAYTTAEALLEYPEDLIHKANGWLLREAGKTDPDRLEAFLRKMGPRLPRTTLRYAIEKFPAAKRKILIKEI